MAVPSRHFGHLEEPASQRIRSLFDALFAAAVGAGGLLWRFAMLISDWIRGADFRVFPLPVARVQPWRLVVGALTVLVPATLLALVTPDMPVTTPGVALIAAVAFSAYLADWLGGLTALVLASLILYVFFIGDGSTFSWRDDSSEVLGFAITVSSGFGLVWLIERIKKESAESRQSAVAARAAANALASMERTATPRSSGSHEERQRFLASVLNAMVRVNRAHAGALFLLDGTRNRLVLNASYGMDEEDAKHLNLVPLSDEFLGAVARERRPLIVHDLRASARSTSSCLAKSHIRAALAVPLISAEDHLIGVSLTGLLVRHQFTPTEIAKLEVLAARAASMVEAADFADERETLLHRAHEAQRRLELVIGTMPEAVVISAPPDGRVVGFNAAAEEILGPLSSAEDKLEVPNRLKLLSADGEDQAQLPYVQALKTGEVVSGVELLVTRPDGREMPVLVSAAPIREPDGAIAAVVTVLRDIAALKEASRIKDEFVSVVSHELRSPLTPIRGFVQLVAKDLSREGGHGNHVVWLNSIAGHVDRMTRLVDDLLDVSRLKAGSLDIRPVHCDLIKICRDIINAKTATAGGHRFELVAHAKEVIGNWDSDRLHQVVDNLFSNGIKYSPAGGVVSIDAGIDPVTNDAVLTVSDEGAGISEADRERIFSAFYRTREVTESQIEGLGLGLYICHEIVAAHGGTIHVGTSVRGGAAFTVRLPMNPVALAR
ncbi:MAG: ATP-binding protein [Thermomicrobiales bacterium]